ncbi:MAG: NAD-dependent epimerase/dehydratase family protein [Acidobacteria bacterium]|nr:NAD-dependent epimerase/dehydratase family protein [Acidobacteriota bacterium]
MQCLVTGGAGFIGSHVTDALLDSGHHVALFDNLNGEYDPALKRRNVSASLAKGSVEFFEGDVRDETALAAAMASFRPEIVFHLAALPGVRRSVEFPALYIDNNVQGTATALECARRAKVRKFVFASSSSVYGLGTPIPFDEERTSTLPISPYAASKLAGEKLCHAYSHLYGLQVVCLRLFTVYGPRQRPDLAFHKFIRAMLAGSEITTFGDGSMRRDFTFYSDAVAGLLAAMNLDAPFETINIGGGRTYSLKDVFEVLVSVTGRPAKTRPADRQPGDVDATFACIDKARRLLGYEPAVSLLDGMRRQVDWQRQQGYSDE